MWDGDNIKYVSTLDLPNDATDGHSGRCVTRNNVIITLGNNDVTDLPRNSDVITTSTVIPASTPSSSPAKKSFLAVKLPVKKIGGEIVPTIDNMNISSPEISNMPAVVKTDERITSNTPPPDYDEIDVESIPSSNVTPNNHASNGLTTITASAAITTETPGGRGAAQSILVDNFVRNNNNNNNNNNSTSSPIRHVNAADTASTSSLYSTSTEPMNVILKDDDKAVLIQPINSAVHAKGHAKPPINAVIVDDSPQPFVGSSGIVNPVFEVKEGSANVVHTNGFPVDIENAPGWATGEGSILSVHNLSYKVKISPSFCSCKSIDKPVLSNITGVFKPGLNAILGPTGSGKTSLLNVLADRVNRNNIEGHILMNGRPIPRKFKCIAGYVVQDDILVGTLSVRENFAFSAALRLSMKVTNAERQQRVEDVIKELGLQDCADTKIGTPFIRGVSGGERKRCNIGMELIISPPVLFLDEPTSSLDANTANTVLDFLKRLASRGRTIIFSIHQPRYSIYKLFDSMMLLSGGQMAFHGPAPQALEFFNLQGFKCQEHNNPPDFFLDVINGDKNTLREVYKRDNTPIEGLDSKAVHNMIIEGYKESQWNVQLHEEASKLWKDYEATKGATGYGEQEKIGYASPFLHQLGVVANRTVKDLFRNPQTGLTMIGTSVFFALVLIGVFWQLGDDPVKGYKDRSGVLFFMILIQLFFNLSAMDNYVKEKVIYLHESNSGYYRTSVYFLVKVFCEIVPLAFITVMLMSVIVYNAAGLRETTDRFFLFAFCIFLVSMAASGTCFFMAVFFQTFAAGQLVMAVAYTLMVLFSGFVVNLSSIADWLSWLQYLSFIQYALAGLYINEFKGATYCVEYIPNNVTCIDSGTEFMKRVEIDFGTDWDFWKNYLALGLFALVLYTMTYVQLRRMKKKKN